MSSVMKKALWALLPAAASAATVSIEWKTDMTAEEQAVSLCLGDTAEFTWTGTHNVRTVCDPRDFCQRWGDANWVTRNGRALTVTPPL